MVQNIGVSDVIVSFNDELKPWQYSWKSHKHSSHELHCFVVVVCQAVGDDTMHIVDSARSSPFKIHSKSIQPAIKDKTRTKASKKRKTENAEAISSNSIEYVVKEPTVKEYRDNRTLDRLHKFMSLNELGSDQGFAVTATVLLSCLRTETVPHDIQVKSVLDNLLKVKKNFLTLMRNNHKLGVCISQWFGNVQEFQDKCQKQSNSDVDWYPELEDETFNPNSTRDWYIFAEFRQVYRDSLSQAVRMSGFNIEDFYEVMQVASHQGALQMDPYHPPSADVSHTLCQQLYAQCQSLDMSLYSTGQAEFSSEKSHRIYGRDLLRYRCKIDQQIVLRHIRSYMEEIISKRTSFSPPDPRIDMCGVWVDCELASLENPSFPGVQGAMLGPFSSKMTKQMYAKLKVVVTDTAISATCANSVLNLRYVFDEVIRPLHTGYPPNVFQSKFNFFSTEAMACEYFAFPEFRDPMGSIVIVRHFGLFPPANFVQETYPAFYRRYRCSTYLYLGLMGWRYESNSPSQVKIDFVDYLIPISVPFEFKPSQIRELYSSGTYIVAKNTNVYTRHFANTFEDEEPILSLII